MPARNNSTSSSSSTLRKLLPDFTTEGRIAAEKKRVEAVLAKGQTKRSGSTDSQ